MIGREQRTTDAPTVGLRPERRYPWLGVSALASGAALAVAASSSGAPPEPSAPVVTGRRVVSTPVATFHLSAREHGVASRRLRFSCKLDGGAFRRCAASYRVRVAPGAHVLRVRAVDPAGRKGPTTRVAFRVEQAAPNPVQTIPVGSRPVDVAVGGGSLWVSNQDDGTVSRLDPASRTVTATIPVGGQPGGVGFGDGSLWVANFGDGTVERVDAATNAVTARIAVGGQPDGAALAADGTVWISDFAGAVLRIDPVTNRVVARIPLPSGASTVAAAFGLVWIGLQDGTIATVDPSTSALAGTSIAVDRDVDALAVAPDGVWAVTYDSGTVALVDPSTRTLVRRGTVAGHASGVVLDSGALWVSVYDRDEVVRLDPATLRVTRTVSVGARPRTVASAAGSLWVVNEFSGSVSRFAP